MIPRLLLLARRHLQLLCPDRLAEIYQILIHTHTRLNAIMEIFNLTEDEVKLFIERRLIQIANENREYFTTAMTWNTYVNKYRYPASNTYNHHFGPWEDAKFHIFGKDAPPTQTNIKVKAQYTLEELKEIAKEWNAHAEKNSFPWAGTFASYFGTWQKSKIFIFGQDSIKPRNKYTKESLKEIAIKHRFYFTTVKEWDIYVGKMNCLILTHLFYIMRAGTKQKNMFYKLKDSFD
ncbi:hypothetical protein KHA93_22290 [Bacillus sp. FJAT-49732]|uniref:Uncharacterized protein n=1 Tax=Lederbergia citrisecunda TaxID=2833583 RepID=A0A942TPX4_9BACI|nr:hypothetical protein [Lederbergia citrisecunda]MBS4202335.1 hypothetical protein [Lederbergia citrisecunda]